VNDITKQTHGLGHRAAQVLAGFLGAAILIAITEAFPVGGLLFLIVVSATALTSLAGGANLPLGFRVFATAAIFYLGYAMCLIGRTEEPGHLFLGYSEHTCQSAFLYFGLLAATPALCLARLWRRRLAVLFLTALLPVCLIAAGVVASLEERQFIARYHDVGVGPTARWTVSMHWLSYDRDAQRLNGSD
jgi:hypothetical protein